MKLQLFTVCMIFAIFIAEIDAFSWKRMEQEGKNFYEIARDFLPVAEGYLPQLKKIAEVYNKRKDRPDLYGNTDEDFIPKKRTIVIDLENI